MRILLDQNINPRIRRYLLGHFVVHTQRLGWDRLPDPLLLRAAERNQYQVIITADKKMLYQQNNAIRTISIVLLRNASWETIQVAHESIREAVETSTPGSFQTV